MGMFEKYIDLPLGKRLRWIRRLRGMKQVDVATACGFHAASYGNWEQGRTTPTVDSILPLCDALGVSTDLLLTPTSFSEEDFWSFVFSCCPQQWKGVLEQLLYALSQEEVADNPYKHKKDALTF